MRKNYLVIALFLAATAFFICQHAVSVSWDFATYVLNAKYWFSGGNYFEILRPPLMPFLLGIFSIFGWKASEYIFIIIVSALFAYSSIKLAKALEFNPAFFYALSLNFYVLNYGMINGTELLSLALLELAVAFILDKKARAGLFLGLSALSRYTGLALFPLLLFEMNWKKIIQGLLLFAAVLGAWFVYNFVRFGNFFTSMADQYANNVLYREYLQAPAKFADFVVAQNILLPFIAVGLVISFFAIYNSAKISFLKKSFSKNGKSKTAYFAGTTAEFFNSSKIDIIMILLLAFAANSYFGIPVKNPRYLFTIMLPSIYFAYLGIRFLVSKLLHELTGKHFRWTKFLLYAAGAIAIAAMFLVALGISSINYDPKDTYVNAIEKLAAENKTNCSIQSNSWIKLNYYGIASAPYPRKEFLSESVNSGNVVVLFSREPEPEYVFDSEFMSKQMIIYKDDQLSILSNGECIPPAKYTKSYLEQINDVYSKTYNESLNINPCIILFHSISLAERTCNFINFNGFSQDINRAYK